MIRHSATLAHRAAHRQEAELEPEPEPELELEQELEVEDPPAGGQRGGRQVGRGGRQVARGGARPGGQRGGRQGLRGGRQVGRGGGGHDDRGAPQPKPEIPPPPPDANAPTFAQVLASQHQFMANLATLLGNHNQNPPPDGQPHHYHQPETLTRKIEGFIKLRPPTFEFSEDPLEADDWLREIEKKLDLTTCTDEECVTLATHQLTGTARAWWDSFSETHPDPTHIGWDEFTKAFREFYVPKEIMVHKAAEFRRLKQGQLRVQEYASVFTKMMRYAPDDTDSEEKRQYWFKLDLHRGIRQFLSSTDYSSLRQMINKAIAVERERLDYEDSTAFKKKRSDSSARPGPSQRPRNGLAPPMRAAQCPTTGYGQASHALTGPMYQRPQF